jgi:glycosyltransferase involved in cell wall biosynthesis
LSPPSSFPQAERDTTGMPGLTVVVLTYNSAATIGACLDALVRQEYKDFDVVVVDDDSSDETLTITSDYTASLRLSVTKNGSHNIPRGRNIGIDYSQTELVAFVDSDDLAADDWTRVIVETFREHPDTALIAGDLVPAYRTSVAHAIALNDDAVRQLFGSGLILFGVGNSAINRKVLPDARFNEDFRFAEDLEFVARVNEHYAWRYVREMKIHHYSRETFAQYAKQMYQYGYMKMHFSYAARSYRWLDFVPIALLVVGGVAGLALRSWWPLLGNLPFALAEALFVVCYQRCTARIAALTFPAWVVKNLCWSYGLMHGLVTLALDGDVRRLLRSKRAVRT